MFFKTAGIKSEVQTKITTMKTRITEMKATLESINTSLAGDIQNDVKSCMGDTIRDSYLGQCNEMAADTKKIIDECNSMISELDAQLTMAENTEIYKLDKLSMYNKTGYCTEVITSVGTIESQDVSIVQGTYTKTVYKERPPFKNGEPTTMSYPAVTVSITGYDSQKFKIANIDGNLKIVGYGV